MSETTVLSTENVEGYIRDMMTALVHSTKTSSSIPAGSDYEYYSNFESFRKGMGDLSSNLAEQIQHICQVVQRSSDDTSSPPIDLAEGALYDLVVDMIDVLLESANHKMDLMAGGGGDNLAASIRDTLKTDQDRLFAGKCIDIKKPQLEFYEEIDNSRRRPFRPRLNVDKPHAIVPLDISEQPVERDRDEDLSAVGPNTFYPHPYSREILAVCNRSQYPSQIADAGFVSPEFPSAGQPFELVQCLDALTRMAEELDGVKEVGVDLEHHHWRTFQGLTCLMQLSCRDKDYIVDVIALRQHMHLLLPLFTDPDVVKVFHGCEKDIMWLQRDLGLYVVNCFDTYQAAKVLRYPALSLAHLLKYYCGVTLNKKYQLADWRERPLPEHLIEYAKLDTHFLLYVYDCLRRDVHASLGSTGIEAVFEASRRTCLQRFEKASFYPLGYLKLVNFRTNGGAGSSSGEMTFEQNATLSCLWNWRDLTARRNDESCGYIMSNAELLRIGMAVPVDVQGIVATGPLSVYVREHLEDIASVIREQVQGGGGGGGVGERGSSAVTSSVATTSAYEGVEGEEDHFMLNLSSPSRLSKKRSSFEIGMGGSRHQMGRMQGYSTVTEFTPCLLPVPAVSSFHIGAAAHGNSALENTHRNYQDVMDNDPEWKKKLFEEAKWRPHTSASARVQVESPLDPVLSGVEASVVGNKMKSRVEKSESELKQYSIGHEINKSVFTASDAASSNQKESSKTSVAESNKLPNDIELLDTLPKSLSEIYNISNRNRYKNKDKKRVRDSSDSAVTASVLDAAESSQSTDWYHVEKDKEGSGGIDSVDGTLDFAASIGWMGKDSSTREEMRQKHLSNESNNNSVHVATNSGHPQEQSAISRSDNVSSSFDGKKSGAKGSNKQSFHKDNKGQAQGVFDYSRASNANSAMGAMSTVNTSSSGGEGGKYNPFLSGSSSGGGNGGYSNAANRSNNNNAPKARKQPAVGGKSKHNPVVIERRDTNRSHIFSAPTNK